MFEFDVPDSNNAPEASSASVGVEVGDSFESDITDEVNLLSTRQVPIGLGLGRGRGPGGTGGAGAGAGAAPSTSSRDSDSREVSSIPVPSRDLPDPPSDSSLVMVRLARNFLSKLSLESRPKNFDCLATKYVVGGRLDDNKREAVPLREICTCTLKNAEASELVQYVSLWSLEGVEIVDATKDTGNVGIGSGPSLLLMQMADSNAWGPALARTDATNCRPFYIPDASADHDCQVLLQRKLIKPCPDSPDLFVITKRGTESLRLKLSAGNQRSLDDFQRCFGCILETWQYFIISYFLLHLSQSLSLSF